MGHNLKISVSPKPPAGGIVALRSITIRERILRLLFGDKCKLMILTPGDSVREVSIVENSGRCK